MVTLLLSVAVNSILKASPSVILHSSRLGKIYIATASEDTLHLKVCFPLEHMAVDIDQNLIVT